MIEEKLIIAMLAGDVNVLLKWYEDAGSVWNQSRALQEIINRSTDLRGRVVHYGNEYEYTTTQMLKDVKEYGGGS